MKTSTEKILARKEKELAIKEWWAKNRYKVNRVILFPLWVSVEIYNKRKENVISMKNGIKSGQTLFFNTIS